MNKEELPSGQRPPSDISVVVPSDLRGCHPLISKTKKALEKQRWDHNGIVHSMEKGTLNVTVSRASFHRALRIMQAVITAVESKGWRLVIEENQSSYSVKVGEEVMGIRIGERTRRFEIPPKRPPHESFLRQYEFKPTGILYLKITDYVAGAGRDEWTERKRQALEEMVPDFIEGLAAAAESRIRWHREHEEQKRRREEDERRRQELERRKQVELERRNRLLKQVENYKQAADLRKLVADFRSSENLPEFWTDEARTRWASWTARIADKLDPFRNGYFSDKLAKTDFGAGLG